MIRYQPFILAIGISALFLGIAVAEEQGGEAQQAKKLFARATPDDYMGSAACADCHSEKAAAFAGSPHAQFVSDPHLPKDKQGCEGCHGPGAIHQAEENAEVLAYAKMSAKESAAACLRCHGQTLSQSHWKSSSHARSDMSCVSCHQIHPDSATTFEPGAVRKGNAQDPAKPVFTARVLEKGLLKADEATLCGQCHSPQLAEFRLSSHHPLPEGRVVCSDCHNAHPSKNSKADKPGMKGTCVKCHTEKAGPFVFEHEPNLGHSGDGCAECHKAHGSNNPKLLNSVSRGLCAQCHTEKLGTHYPGRTCWSAGCHVASHGSNTDPRFLRP